MKAENKQKLLERAEQAIQNLYHNATLPYTFEDAEDLELSNDHYQNWINDVASFEIEYINDGGAYGIDYHETLRATCNAGQYTSKRAQDYYIRKGMRSMRLERSKFALWERITDYGKLYTWGRGGATLAPDDLIRQGGGSSFSCSHGGLEDLDREQQTELCLIVEAFNKYVENTCAYFPTLWKEHLEELRADREEERQTELKEQAQAMEQARPDMYQLN